MSSLLAALYARVSSSQQATTGTIQSQLAALREQAAADGVIIPADREFVDDGYSGATLLRPALEALRDLVAAGGVERLYVHSPDRLARNYAYQVLLLEEFTQAGMSIVFLNRPLGQSPEDDLLLQVQGMVAEYERAKALERSRRGKRHAAHSGAVSVLCGAPYGYRYLAKQQRTDQACYVVVPEEARVVQQVFAWVGHERVSIGEVVRRLQAAGERTRTGKTVWDRSTVWAMLKNPAYKGQAAFGKTRSQPLGPRLRTQRSRPVVPRRATSYADRPPEEWIYVPVPALIEEALWAAVQEQLTENRQRARQGQRGARYLLQGLVVCAQCGYAYYGKALSPSARKGHPRSYAYYRCIGMDAYRFGGERICSNHQVRTDLLEGAVWEQVCAVLEEPRRLAAEYQRRVTSAAAPSQEEQHRLEGQVSKLRQSLGRLIDGYMEGLLRKEEFEPRLGRLRERIAGVEAQVQQARVANQEEQVFITVLGQLEEFAAQVREGLASADWSQRRELIRALVKRVSIGAQEVQIVFRIGPGPPLTEGSVISLQHCGRSERSALHGPPAPFAVRQPLGQPAPATAATPNSATCCAVSPTVSKIWREGWGYLSQPGGLPCALV